MTTEVKVGRAPSGQAGRSATGAAKASPPSGDHPSRGNTRIWDAVSKTDPKHTKRVNQRGGFTAIDAQYQFMEATRLFGPIGEGWGYTVGDFSMVGPMIVVPVTLWHSGNRDNNFGPILGCAEMLGQRPDRDAPKKAITDAVTKGLSQLGFNADVFLGLFDDNKYVEQVTREFSGAPTNGDGGSGKDAPFPQGPAKNKTELKAMGRDLWRDVLSCGDSSSLDALLISHKPLLDQLQEGLPPWWNGGEHKGGETFEGLGAIIERLRADFDNINANGVDWRGNPVSAG